MSVPVGMTPLHCLSCQMMSLTICAVGGLAVFSTAGVSIAPCMNILLMVILRPMRCCSPVPCTTVSSMFADEKS